MSDVIGIRPELAEDRASVFAVQAAAFGQPDEAQLVDRLRAETEPNVSLVATLCERVIGHVFVSPVFVSPGTVPGGAAAAPTCGGLAPLGVEPGVQGRGAGGALVRAALVEAARLDWPAVFLLGDPAYYARFGFRLAAPAGFHYQSEAFDPAFQWIELVPGRLAAHTGNVEYAPAFAAL